MSRTTTYEVWIQNGPRWEICARFPRWEHERAIEEAKHLERFHPMANVRVVREEYDPRTGLADELTVYTSPRRKNTFAKSRGGYGGGSGGHWSDYRGTDGSGGSGRQRVTHAGLFFTMTLLTVSGASIATVLTYLASLYVHKLAAFGIASQSAQSNTLYIIFLAVFLSVTISLVGNYLSRIDLDSLPKRRRRRGKSSTWLAAKSIIPEPKHRDPEAGHAEEETPEPEPEAEQEAEDDSKQEEETKEPESDSTSADDELRIPLTPAGEREKLRMMAFFSHVLDDAKSKGIQLDTSARFGFNLYLAGASEAIGNAEGLDRTDVAGILQEAVTLLGTNSAQSRKFAEGFEGYLLDARHMAMFQAGRQAMASYLEGKFEGARNFAAALNLWLNPQESTPDPDRPIAVLFTDMVGSTDQTQAFGDLAAQYVLRAHNRIVRSALANHGGKEIKHLGDGIMASFDSTIDAVRAATDIQRRVIANNGAEKDLPFPLHVRIGINAGHAVEEDNDLFGATVQLASRLCATADSEEIVVSDVVRELCAGQPIPFVPMEERILKGFKDPIAPFSVTWQEQEPNEPSDTSAAIRTNPIANPPTTSKPAPKAPGTARPTPKRPSGEVQPTAESSVPPSGEALPEKPPAIQKPAASAPSATVTSISEARAAAQAQRRENTDQPVRQSAGAPTRH